MIALKQVLFPTDFSDCSRTAQVAACEFAERFGAELHLLHVLEDALLMMPEPGSALSLPQNYLLDMKQAAERALSGLLPAEWAATHVVHRATRIGNAANEIVKYAAERNIDLIVLGTHGRGMIGHFLAGSVAERVVQHADCPVMTIPSRKNAPQTSFPGSDWERGVRSSAS